jgi:hypothetical protein
LRSPLTILCRSPLFVPDPTKNNSRLKEFGDEECIDQHSRVGGRESSSRVDHESRQSKEHDRERAADRFDSTQSCREQRLAKMKDGLPKHGRRARARAFIRVAL